MKYDLEKNEKRIKATAPNRTEIIMLGVGVFGGALAYDLNLVTFGKLCSFLVIYTIAFGLMWLIDVVIYAIIKKKRSKKHEDK